VRIHREGDYVQQQRVSMKLSKMAGAAAGPQYLWWAVTSLLLQARAAAAGAPGLVKGLGVMGLVHLLGRLKSAEGSWCMVDWSGV